MLISKTASNGSLPEHTWHFGGSMRSDLCLQVVISILLECFLASYTHLLQALAPVILSDFFTCGN